MKCRNIFFSETNKNKYFKMSSAKFAHSTVSIKDVAI